MMLNRFKNFITESIKDKVKKAEDFLIENTKAYQNDDGTWSCNECLDLSGNFVIVYNHKLLIKFKEIKNSFKIKNMFLTSLEGCPEYIEGIFDCSNNDLTSLENGPKIVTEDYVASNNYLKDLNGCADRMGGTLIATHNRLTSLKGCPDRLESLYVDDNDELMSFDGFPNVIERNFSYDDNRVKRFEKIFVSSLNSNGYRLYGKNYWIELLNFMLAKDPNVTKSRLEELINWPEGFLNDNILKSTKTLNKFNL